MRRNRSAAFTAAFAAFALPLLAGGVVLVGCGSGGGGSTTVPLTGQFLTRATENDVSTDARVLAERAADSPRIPLDLARGIDSDLALARAQFPAVADIHPRAQSDLHEVLIKLADGASFASNWNNGQIATGDAALDSELNAYGGVSVRPLSGLANYYVVRFDEPLSIPQVATRLKAASGSIASASPNMTVGDGDNVVRDAGSGQYTFSKGWGDCSAGCINRHNWTFSISGSTVTLVSEGGTPL